MLMGPLIVMFLITHQTSDLKRVLRVSRKKYSDPTRRALETINFLTHNFARR